MRKCEDAGRYCHIKYNCHINKLNTMIVQDKNIIREITPLSEKDCFYIATGERLNLLIRCIVIKNLN